MIKKQRLYNQARKTKKWNNYRQCHNISTCRSIMEAICDPCSEKNKRLVAEKYCSDCEEKLCTECTEWHLFLTSFEAESKGKTDSQDL
jgi:hypothetical protein